MTDFSDKLDESDGLDKAENRTGWAKQKKGEADAG